MVELRRKHDVHEEVPYQTDERRTTGDQGSGTSRRSAAYRQTLARILLMSDESRPNGGHKARYIRCIRNGTLNGRAGASTVCGRRHKIGPEPQEAVASPPCSWPVSTAS